MAKKSLGEKELDEYEKVFKALSHPTRRHILIILHSRGDQVTGKIVERFEDQWPTISRHLRQLEEAELISVTKHGRELIYSLNKEKMRSVLKLAQMVLNIHLKTTYHGNTTCICNVST